MENRKGALPQELRPDRLARFSLFHFPFSIFLLGLLFSGCASPGEPVERKPQVPAPVADLSAEQQGNSVVLSFTLPAETAERRPLKQTPSVEIYRAFAAAGETPGAPALYFTIPPNLVGKYTEQQHFRWSDSLGPADFAQPPASVATYMVRTRASEKRASADSNFARVNLYPPPEAIADLAAEITPSGIALKWTPPRKTLAGSPAAIQRYGIYRALAPVEANAAPKSEAAFVQIGTADSPSYEDSQVDLGKSYLYSVRSESRDSGILLSSGDSNVVTIAFKDIFPPAAPQGLVVVAVPAQGGTPAHLDLSWAISPETDVAGYDVYRSEEVGVLGTRLNADLLPTPAFRDMNVVPGRRYLYRVTALDRSGNEGPASGIVSGGLPAETQSTP